MKVSIITVCLNSDETIKYSLNSVISQDYKNIEHIIIDGGSTDDTIKILKIINLEKREFILKKEDPYMTQLILELKNNRGDLISFYILMIFITTIKLFQKSLKAQKFENLKFFLVM